MIKRLIILFAFLFAFWEGFCQSEVIRVNAKELPLNVILLQLRNQYNFNFSYSEDQVSKYKVTVNKTFESKLEAVEYLLK